VNETFNPFHRDIAGSKSVDIEESGRHSLLAEAFPPRFEPKQNETKFTPAPDDSGARWPMPRVIIEDRIDLQLSQEEKQKIGKKVWNNESSGTFEGLTAWNKGEEFPSLGIGHFIWFPKTAHVPFDQSFPDAMNFVKSEGGKLPAWLNPDKPCPWNSRQSFLHDFNNPKLTELRQFLNDTVPQQTDFLVDRLEKALPEILAKEDPAQKDKIQQRFYSVLNSGPSGVFALVDYVNFKGEGLEPVPGYHNHAWGMKQVLEGMKDTKDPVKDFSDSAKEVLTTRVENSPPARNEKQWLPGWLKRVDRYVSDPPLRAETHDHEFAKNAPLINTFASKNKTDHR